MKTKTIFSIQLTCNGEREKKESRLRLNGPGLALVGGEKKTFKKVSMFDLKCLFIKGAPCLLFIFGQGVGFKGILN